MKSVGEEFQKNSIQTATLLDQKIYEKKIPASSLLKAWAGFLFNFFGGIFGFYLKNASARISNEVTKRLAHSRCKGEVPDFSRLSKENIEWAKEVLKKNVSVLILTSHPKTTPQESEILAKILYRAIGICQNLSPRSKFKFLQAVDPYALDTLSLPLASTYAGFVREAHIALDRQPFERNFLGRWIFRKAHYSSCFFRIIKSLKSGEVFTMALAGGVAHNSRVFYTVKEFAQKIYFNQPVKIFSKRKMENEFIRILSQGAQCACATGAMSVVELAKAKEFLMECGIAGQSVEEYLKELKEELILQTPFRARFFKALLYFLCGRKTQLLVLPLTHSQDGSIELKEPLLISGYEPKSGELTFKTKMNNSSKEHLECFMKGFVKKNLNP